MGAVTHPFYLSAIFELEIPRRRENRESCLILLALPRDSNPCFRRERARFGPSKYSGGVNHSDVAPIEGSCSAIGLHLLIEPVTRPLASWNVVTPLLSVRAVPVTRPAGS